MVNEISASSLEAFTIFFAKRSVTRGSNTQIVGKRGKIQKRWSVTKEGKLWRHAWRNLWASPCSISICLAIVFDLHHASYTFTRSSQQKRIFWWELKKGPQYIIERKLTAVSPFPEWRLLALHMRPSWWTPPGTSRCRWREACRIPSTPQILASGTPIYWGGTTFRSPLKCMESGAVKSPLIGWRVECEEISVARFQSLKAPSSRFTRIFKQ